MKVLVTGGAGFVGSHLSQELVNLGYDVTILDNFSTGSFKNIKNINAKVRQADILKQNSKSKIEQFDVIFHLAAKPFSKANKDWFTESSSVFNTNATGTYNLLRLTKPECHFILISSASVYGEGRALTEEDPYHPLSAYGYSKAIAEQIIVNSNRHYTILRPATIIGPRGRCFPNRIMWSLVHNEECTFFKNGNVLRDIIDVRDVVHALIKIMETKTYGIFNLGTNREIKGFYLSKHAERIAKRKKLKLLSKFTSFVPEDFVIKSTLNSNKLLGELHYWEPLYTLPESLTNIISYYLNNPKAKEPIRWDAL